MWRNSRSRLLAFQQELIQQENFSLYPKYNLSHKYNHEVKPSVRSLVHPHKLPILGFTSKTFQPLIHINHTNSHWQSKLLIIFQTRPFVTTVHSFPKTRKESITCNYCDIFNHVTSECRRCLGCSNKTSVLV